jgi:hypothetical protein
VTTATVSPKVEIGKSDLPKNTACDTMPALALINRSAALQKLAAKRETPLGPSPPQALKAFTCLSFDGLKVASFTNNGD